ncbi:hypothetical protein [Pseudomonas psychrophila]|uniref:hypothetical protein n=1 Tax=Pseudomonas psychrophila TaxID=122355 RepID=UPI00381D78FA
MSNKKKGRRNKDPKIPRDHYVVGHTAGIVSQLTFVVNPDTGRGSVAELDPASLRSQISHVRINGKDDKVLYSSPVDDFAALDESFITQLQKKFDYLMAVDTNTIADPPRTQGCRVSVCVSVAIAEQLDVLPSQLVSQPVAGFLILDPGPDVNPELLGWHLNIDRLAMVPELNTKRIGVIVDTELGLLPDINARKIPYYEKYILPANMTLIYASSDKPELFVNQMIKHCDVMAELGIAEFRKHDVGFMSRVRGHKYGTAICVPIVQKKLESGATFRAGTIK